MGGDDPGAGLKYKPLVSIYSHPRLCEALSQLLGGFVPQSTFIC
jgi:hypothetical protein